MNSVTFASSYLYDVVFGPLLPVFFQGFSLWNYGLVLAFPLPFVLVRRSTADTASIILRLAPAGGGGACHGPPLSSEFTSVQSGIRGRRTVGKYRKREEQKRPISVVDPRSSQGPT